MKMTRQNLIKYCKTSELDDIFHFCLFSNLIKRSPHVRTQVAKLFESKKVLDLNLSRIAVALKLPVASVTVSSSKYQSHKISIQFNVPHQQIFLYRSIIIL